VIQDDKNSASQPSATPEEIEAIKKKLEENEWNLTALTSDEIAKLRFVPEPLQITLDTKELKQLAEALGLDPEKVKAKEVPLTIKVVPAKLTYLTVKGEGLLQNRQYISTLSVQEGFVIYFKVSILCAIILAMPFMLYQFWAFVGAGLYPHEKQYVYSLFGPSVALFVIGILMCQFLVLPGAVKALLGFNEWLGFDPDIRLREWLGLAIILPLVFGISFQTPLVMVALNRIGIFSAQDYLSKWRQACMILAVFAAVITPTPDAVTMLYLFVPLFGLYMLGIGICFLYPGRIQEPEPTESAEEVAV
jgi:sec-independent protein translocase protein TatC